MAIITISRGSYSRGKEVAEKVAAELGYDCLSRDVVLEAAKQLLIPELKLIRALHDAPSILDRMIGGKEKYIDEFRNVLLSFLKKDNVIYHGLAGQFFLNRVLTQALAQGREDHIVESLVLIETREDDGFLAGFRVLVQL